MDRSGSMKNWKDSIPDFLGNDFFSEFKGLVSDNNGSARANIYESGNEIICTLSLPGLKLEEVDIYVYQRTLEIRGTLHFDYQGYRLIQEEISQGTIKRSIELPYPVRDDMVDATYRNGILIIHLHRLIQSNKVRKKVNVKNLDDV
ncbi:Hsp20/alpha crystallin family protein [Bacillus sp. FJAT-45350]|uniref:Hsp20/alpha crystallin family protein n=1 Tax=Bacillus sp. FJAT-45350 TaxID=2011014 RepID=UPI000BB726AE|nr:Hsp20/alpha crystallin family protein [Bacillus sp. FJAT-45350]